MNTAPTYPAAGFASMAAFARRAHAGRARLVPVWLVLGSAALMCHAAHADPVRKCQVEGRTVFQSAPCPPQAQATAVAMRPAAAPAAASAGDADGPPKKKTLAELLRERDGADRPRAQAQETQTDGAKVLRARMGAV